MPNLEMMVGPPGSGKSTCARDYADSGYIYINQDSQGRDHLKIFEQAILDGKNIVVDRMNFNKSQRARYLDPAKKAGYKTAVSVIHQPYSVCLERCLKRKDHETIKDETNARSALSLFFGKYERPTQDEADLVQFCYPQLDDYKPPAIICDLDGTLCNVDHRLHFVRRPKGERKDWKGFFDGIEGDSVNQWCADILSSLSANYKIIYCSGRPDDRRKETERWLEKYNLDEFNWTGNIRGPLHHRNLELYMRPRNDSRQDNIVKEIILDFEILTRFTPYFMIDDRQQVVDMWRSRGYTCLQCAKGEF